MVPWRRLFAFVVSFTLLFPGVSVAACALSDVGGLWQVYSVGNTGAVRCIVKVSGAGVIDQNNSTCVFTDGTSTRMRGNLVLNSPSRCTFSGSVTYISDGFVNRVRHSTLTKDKLSGSGIGTATGGFFLFTLVRL